VAAVWAAAWGDIFFLVKRSPLHDFFDLRVYRGAVQSWLHGGHLYAFLLPHTTYGFTYPPFAALVLLPLAWLGLGTAAVLVTAASTAVVGALTWWLIGPLAARCRWSRGFATALAVPAVLALEPIRDTLGYGQINMLIFALVIVDVLALRRHRAWAGVGIGLAMALKVTPGLFVVFLVLAGRRRAAAVAAATFLAATLLASALAGTESVQFWTHELWNTSRVGRLDRTNNQSLLGVLARLAYPADPSRGLWLALAGIVLVVGVRRALRAYRSGDDLTAFTLVGLTGCAISPVSWTHHLYWVVPALVIVLDVALGSPLHDGAPGWLRARPRAVAAGAGTLALVVAVPFLFSLVWVFAANRQDGGAVGALSRDSYALLVVLLVAFLPVRGARAAARTTAPPRPAGSSPR
jgi:alpha-1,2-mannosyltransferase